MELMNIAELRVELEELHSASFGWALSCCRGDRAEAEEVLQTVYLKIVEGKARFRAEASLKTWLFAVIRKTAVNEHRRRVIRRLRFTDNAIEVTAQIQVPAHQQASLERTELQVRFRKALNGLASRQREALHLVFYEELSLREAALIMHVSIGSARQHYERGKKRLRDLLKQTEESYGNDWRRTEHRDAFS
jgi:RNA polymerase sigma-70 factor (ECF subfamily)